MSADARHGIPNLLTCPQCDACAFDLRSFDSMMVLSADLALFSLTCPSCGARISALQPIPPSLRDEVDFAAIRIGAGMGETGR